MQIKKKNKCVPRGETRAKENSSVSILNMRNGKMCRKNLNPRYLGLNLLVSVNELFCLALTELARLT